MAMLNHSFVAPSAGPQLDGHAGVTSSSAPRVVIVGGGFGGLYAAVRLSSLFWPKGKTPQITLVDKGDRFTFKPLMYELLNNTATEDEVAPYFTQLLAPYLVEFIQGQVLGLEPEALLPDGGSACGGKVQLAGGAVLEYDWLVVALGSATDSRGVPGVKELALPFNVYEDAVKVKAALETIEASPGSAAPRKIMVVGAGYAGVELTTVIAERMRGRASVQLVTPAADILDSAPDGQRAAAKKVLASQGVEVLTGAKVQQLRPAEATPGPQGEPLPTSCVVDMQMGDGAGSSVPEDLVLWSAGASPVTKDAKGRSGLPLPFSPRGSILTEPTLRVQKHERVFALGDVSGPQYEDQGTAAGGASASASTSSSPLPATAQVAFQQADYVAWNLWAAMNGRALLPFRYQHLGSMMSLGQLNAAVALPLSVPPPLASTLKDSPLGPLLDIAGIKLGGSDPESGVTLEGPLAALARRAAYLYRQPTNEQRLNVATSWLQQALSVASGGLTGKQ